MLTFGFGLVDNDFVEKRRLDIGKKSLERLYWDKQLSTYKIAEVLHCDPKTVWYHLKNEGVPTRPRKVVYVSKEDLIELYKHQGLSLREIGDNYSIVPAAVLRKMRKFNIPLRSTWEHNLIKPRKPFSGSLTEKAYLIGFRLGDLNVIQRPGRQVVEVGCNSTKTDQAQLIKRLFSKYSHVSVSKQNDIGVMSINTSLDRSFGFLIPKVDKVEKWMSSSRKFMAAFTAGYTDAEGNAGVYTNRARFRLGSYDIGILKEINRYFNKLQIQSILNLERPKGSIGSHGLALNGDFWRVTVNERLSILKLYDLLWPHLKHKKRRRDFLKAKRNVLKRIKLVGDKIQA